MATKVDTVIKGGKVFSSEKEAFEVKDIYIQGNKIVEAPPSGEAAKVVDATGYLVFPGLIDYHVHVFPGGSHIGINPDSGLLCQGVTTVFDQGSAGINNFDSFMQDVVYRCQTRVYANIHVSPVGTATLPYMQEPINDTMYDVDATRLLMEKYDQRLLGLKIRQSRPTVGEHGIDPLKETVKMGNELQCPVTVHTTNPPCGCDEMADVLRAGDTYTHVYQGKGHTIIDENGKVRPGIRRARERGVIFDTADGRVHYAFSVIKAALADGFEPDIISTDIVTDSLFERTVFGLPMIITKYVGLGLSLEKVITCCTKTPAKAMQLAGKIGTLAPGAFADVAIFKEKETAYEIVDNFDEKLMCQKLYVPQMTILDGRVVYRSIEF